MYLVYHKELEEYRAVKIVPKSISDYETFKKEALFLKNLRHPGIPLVYDVEEDLHQSYLIEEYLEGESLYALVKRLGSLSVKMTVDLGIRICQIIQFMNTTENPILYLDLQPKNLLLCDGEIRLIDFDHAQYAQDVQTFGERYGTIGFAAPEQYLGEPLDCRTDVYAIGALLYFMCRGKPPGKEPEFGNIPSLWTLERIIHGCLAPRKDDRYKNAEELEHALKEWNNNECKGQAADSLTIVFAGAKAGIGTTHAALGLSAFLARNGCQTLYQEEYDTDTVRNLVRNQNVKADTAGVYHIGCLNIRPFYGKSVKLPYRYFPIIIKDAGVLWNEKREVPAADFYVLVCGGKWWETDRTICAVRHMQSCGKLVVLWNHISKTMLPTLPREFRKIPCMTLPFYSNPLKQDSAVNACFKQILCAGTGDCDKWNGKKRNGWFWKRKPG